MSPRSEEFLTLSDEAVRAVSGPNSRHAALLEDAFHVLIETPGGGVSLRGDAKNRAAAKRAVYALAERANAGSEVTEADVRVMVGAARSGGATSFGESLTVGRRGPIAPKTAAQARYVELLQTKELVFGIGPAGTGKTFLAVAYGATLLLKGSVDRLVITRPAVEAGERLGFLPGDLMEKVDPYLAPIWSALDDILGPDNARRRRDRGEIEVAPLAFMRGRTLSHAYVIVDEAQNTTRLQMKMVLTRLGEGARMAVTGDPSQVDLINPRDSGLAQGVRILDGVEGVGITTFSAADIVRHKLVERIVRAYDADIEAPPAYGEGGRRDPRMIEVEVEVEVDIEDWAWLADLPKAEAVVQAAARAALAGGPAPAGSAVSVLLASDAEVAALNKRFRGKEGATNVLSFPAPESARPHLGDIALARETCVREAREQGKPLSNHLSHLVAHGALHLLGWDHRTDDEADAMEALERTVLATLGIPDPYASRHETDAERRPD